MVLTGCAAQKFLGVLLWIKNDHPLISFKYSIIGKLCDAYEDILNRFRENISITIFIRHILFSVYFIEIWVFKELFLPSTFVCSVSCLLLLTLLMASFFISILLICYCLLKVWSDFTILVKWDIRQFFWKQQVFLG